LVNWETDGKNYFDTIETMILFCIPMNVPASSSRHPESLRVTLRLTQRSSGHYSAAIVEFPEYQAEAATRDEAIALVKTAFLEQVAHIETIPWDVPVSNSTEPTWVKSAGIFQDNPVFDDVMKRVQAERDAWGDEEIDASEYAR
jgi:predicted RNase H-like HicB family nuclease